MATEELTEMVWQDLSARVRTHLRRHYPGVCVGWREDASQDAFRIVLESYDVGEVITGSGHKGLGRLLCVIAWRSMRGRLRLASTRLERGGMPREPRTTARPDDELMVDEVLDQLIGRATERHGHGQGHALAHALRLRLVLGHSDTDSAVIAGTRREYVNAAKRSIQRDLASTYGIHSLGGQPWTHDVSSGRSSARRTSAAA